MSPNCHQQPTNATSRTYCSSPPGCWCAKAGLKIRVVAVTSHGNPTPMACSQFSAEPKRASRRREGSSAPMRSREQPGDQVCNHAIAIASTGRQRPLTSSPAQVGHAAALAADSATWLRDGEATASVPVACPMARSETVCGGHSRARGKLLSRMGGRPLTTGQVSGGGRGGQARARPVARQAAPARTPPGLMQ